MVIFRKTKDLQHWIADRKTAGDRIGFVPTMGALHEGHQSLVARSVADGCHTVCSIFVNPTQFNDKEDFNQYPATPEQDLAMLAAAGCHAVFMPGVDEMYPQGMDAGADTYRFPYLETILEGAQRPGHFKGVGQIVSRLLLAVQPHRLYMGQKDYQQCMVVRELLQQMDMTSATELVICPTRREADGLAMSSRNRRLTEPQRALAGIIYQCLVSVQSKKDNTSFAIVQKECLELMTAKGFEPEYVALANAGNLQLLDEYDVQQPMVALIAARLGGVRLIDNLLLQ